MFFKSKFHVVLLYSLLLLISIGGVCATDPDTNITDLDNNCLVDVNCSDNNIYTLNHDNVLYASDNVTALTNNDTVINDSSDLSDVPCAVSSYISVMESYNKSVDIGTGIKDTNTINNVTSVDGLVSALTNQGLNCNVIKTNIENLTILYKDKNLNIILHMFIKNNYHYGHIKEIKKDGILFNDNLFIPFNFLNACYTGISIIITNDSNLNISCFGVNINKSEWPNFTGRLTQRELFNYNYGLISKSIILNNEYVKLKANIKNDSDKKGIESLEFILFGDTLKPNIVTLLKIQKDLAPIYNNKHAPVKALIISNNVLTPMQHNLNETISSLDYLINMINKYCNNKDTNIKSSHNSSAITLKHVNVPKSLDECKKAIIENNLLNQFVENFKESVNNLNPLNAYPELREYYDDKYGLDHHKIGFIDIYTIKK